MIRTCDPAIPVFVSHSLPLPVCCPVSANPRPGSTIRISYRPQGTVLPVEDLAAWIAEYVDGHTVRGVRDMERMIQDITGRAQEVVGVAVRGRGDLIIRPPYGGDEQAMRVNARSVPGPMTPDKEHAPALMQQAADEAVRPLLYIGRNWKDEARRYSGVFAYKVAGGADWVPLYSVDTIATLTARLAAAEKQVSLAAEEAAAEVEQAHDEGYQEGVEEGRCEAQGAAADVFNFMYRWLKARDLLSDEGDGIDVNDVEEALRIYGGEAVIYERQRADRADQRAEAAEAKVAVAAEDERDRLYAEANALLGRDVTDGRDGKWRNATTWWLEDQGAMLPATRDAHRALTQEPSNGA